MRVGDARESKLLFESQLHISPWIIFHAGRVKSINKPSQKQNEKQACEVTQERIRISLNNQNVQRLNCLGSNSGCPYST